MHKLTEVTRRDSNDGQRLLRATVLLAIAAAVACAMLATLPAQKPAAQTGTPAPQTLKKAMWGLTEHNGTSLFPIYKDLGVGIFETQVRWDAIAPTKPANPTDPNDPAYKWGTHLAGVIAEAEANGMTVMLQIIGTPTWANAGQTFTYPPTNPADYGNFAAAISKKYPSVRHWMVWGEPNSKRGFGPVVNGPLSNNTKLNKKQQRAPRLYAGLLDAAYGALKGVNPGNLVIGGNTYQGAGKPVIRTFQWLRYLLLPDGTRPRMDMWGHNPYTYRIPNLKAPASPRGRVDFSDLGRLMKAFDKAYPKQRLRLFLSEWGVPTGLDQDLQIRVKTKAAVKWVKAGMKIVRKTPRIYTIGWSVPVDTTRNPQGLLDSSLTPKATYFPFKAG